MAIITMYVLLACIFSVESTEDPKRKMTNRVIVGNSIITSIYHPPSKNFTLAIEGGSDCYTKGNLLMLSHAVKQRSFSMDTINVFNNDETSKLPDFFHLFLNLSVPTSGHSELKGFAAVQPSVEAHFKHLPFNMEDLYYLFHLFSLPRMHDAATLETLSVSLPLPLPCLPHDNITQISTLPVVPDHILSFPQTSQDLLITTMILLFSFHSQFIPEKRYEICILSASEGVFRDKPFVMRRCCRLCQRHMFQDGDNDVDIWCHDPGVGTRVIGYVITILCVIVALFLPLIIVYLPSNPIKMRPYQISDKSLAADSASDKADDKAHPHEMDTIKTQGDITEAEAEFVGRRVHSHDGAANEHVDGINAAPKSENYPNIYLAREPSASSRGVLDMNLVYLDSDPVFYLSPSSLIATLLCLSSGCHALILLLRFLCLYVAWGLCTCMSFIIFLYYDSMLQQPLLYLNGVIIGEAFRIGHMETMLSRTRNEKQDELAPALLWLFVYGPCLLTVMTMFLLYSVLLIAPNIAKALIWKHTCSIMGVKFKCSIKRTPDMSHSDSQFNFKHQNDRHQTILFNMMCHNVLHVKEKAFWYAVWSGICCRYSKSIHQLGRSESPVSDPRQKQTWRYLPEGLIVLLMMPLTLLSVLFHTLPLFTVFTRVAREPNRMLIPRTFRRFKCALFVAFPVTCLGITVVWILMFELALLNGTALCYLTVDVLRKSDQCLSRVIFALSVLIYIRQAFVEFEDQYRLLKARTFRVAQELRELYGENDNSLVLTCDDRTPLLLSSGDEMDKLAMIKDIFVDICCSVRPYRTHVLKTLMSLFLSLLLILVLFMIAIEFQIFKEFSLIGETVVTIMTVSIPKLFGLMRSEGHDTLKAMREEYAIRSIILSHTVVKPVRNHQ